MNEHFEDKEDVNIHINLMYTEYLDDCAEKGKGAVEDVKFKKVSMMIVMIDNEFCS